MFWTPPPNVNSRLQSLPSEPPSERLRQAACCRRWGGGSGKTLHLLGNELHMPGGCAFESESRIDTAAVSGLAARHRRNAPPPPCVGLAA
jgi:hypothetical protein